MKRHCFVEKGKARKGTIRMPWTKIERAAWTAINKQQTSKRIEQIERYYTRDYNSNYLENPNLKNHSHTQEI